MCVPRQFWLRRKELGNWLDSSSLVMRIYFFYFCHFPSTDSLNDFFARNPERCHETDAVEPVVCQPWSTRLSKMAQPNLDFMGKLSEKCERVTQMILRLWKIQISSFFVRSVPKSWFNTRTDIKSNKCLRSPFSKVNLLTSTKFWGS